MLCDCGFITEKPSKLCTHTTKSPLCGAEGRSGPAASTGHSLLLKSSVVSAVQEVDGHGALRTLSFLG